ncbi:SNARE associated Golgi protein [Enhygromyxa salina]|uniref:SNARE associated Golgi protein n=1 Tax=Enhygromyxa salina TaxID=215803 RepID=A0A2S9XHL5_9BACT|nr:YqaA family protein [Enhygromyxa salina]PRP92366.1 SNARE associated Golgi protein [Enhygromyxa salina]
MSAPESADAATSSPELPAKKPNVVRRLYDWVLSWAESPYGVAALFLLAVAESSFFPIPPDVLLIALALSAPTKAFRFAAWCTAGSVIGGILGYYIGFGLWTTVEPMLIPTVFSAEKFDQVAGLYNEYGVPIVFAAGFTPIPYKVFTVAAGVAEINLPAFILTSIVGRGARFFLVAAVIRRYGDQARELIDRHFNLVTLAFTILLVGAFLLLKVVLH